MIRTRIDLTFRIDHELVVLPAGAEFEPLDPTDWERKRQPSCAVVMFRGARRFIEWRDVERAAEAAE